MIDVKTAVRSAIAFVEELYGDEVLLRFVIPIIVDFRNESLRVLNQFAC